MSITQTSTIADLQPTAGPTGPAWSAIAVQVHHGHPVRVGTTEGVVVCLSQASYEQLLADAATRSIAKSTPSESTSARGSTPHLPPRQVPRLTERELMTLQAVRQGGTGAQIADRMGVATNTVCQHLHAVRRKYAVSSTAQALAAAVRDGLL